MSYMTLSSQKTPFKTLFMLSHASDNTTSLNIWGDQCMGRPHLKFWGDSTPKVSAPGGVFQRGVKRSSDPISRVPGGGRVAVKVGVVQVEKVNDQMGQGR